MNSKLLKVIIDKSDIQMMAWRYYFYVFGIYFIQFKYNGTQLESKQIFGFRDYIFKVFERKYDSVNVYFTDCLCKENFFYFLVWWVFSGILISYLLSYSFRLLCIKLNYILIKVHFVKFF
jgi:hypothetical protein